MDPPPSLPLRLEEVSDDLLNQPEVVIKLAQSFVVLLGYVEREYAACQTTTMPSP
jgi:hypothetical protein